MHHDSNARVDADCFGDKVAVIFNFNFLPIQVPMPDGDTRHDDGQTETIDEEQSSRPPASPKVRNKNTHPKLSRLDAAHDGLEEPKASAALHTRHALPEDTNSGDLIVTEQTDDAKSDVSDVDNHGDEALDDGNEVRINISKT